MEIGPYMALQIQTDLEKDISKIKILQHQRWTVRKFFFCDSQLGIFIIDPDKALFQKDSFVNHLDKVCKQIMLKGNKNCNKKKYNPQK